MTPSRRYFLVALFVIYLLLLVWAVLWKLDIPNFGGVSSHTIKFVPFVATADAGGSEPLEVIANIVFFLPFGIYLRVLAPKWRWWSAMGATAGVSLLLEVAQYFLGIGIPDASDVLANTAGGLVGFGLAGLLNKSRSAAWTTWPLATATGVIVIAVGVFVTSPGHYAPPQEMSIIPSTGSCPWRAQGKCE